MRAAVALVPPIRAKTAGVEAKVRYAPRAPDAAAVERALGRAGEERARRTPLQQRYTFAETNARSVARRCSEKGTTRAGTTAARSGLLADARMAGRG